MHADLFEGKPVPHTAMEPVRQFKGIFGWFLQISGINWARNYAWNWYKTKYIMMPFRNRNMGRSSFPEIQKAIQYLRKERGIEKIGLIGYCFGGKVVIAECLNQSNDVNAFAVAHPSALKAEDIEKVNVPSLWLCAEVDQAFPDELRNKAQQILEAKKAINRFCLYKNTVRRKKRKRHLTFLFPKQ